MKIINYLQHLVLLLIIVSCSTNKQIQTDKTTTVPIIKTNSDAKFVWFDDAGSGRHQYVYFALEFELESIVQKAILNLFADSRYLLKVNGTNINWGPGRFYPEEIEYDVHDISPYLHKGKNIITVKVLSNGINTYQLIQNIGGMIAWGNIHSNDKTISLSSPGNWKCKKAIGYDQLAPKMTFAQGAFDVYDARIGVEGWDKVEIDRRDWQDVVVIKNQNSWGKLTPRSIPLLTQNEVLPHHVEAVFKLKEDETIYSFGKRIPDGTAEEYAADPWIMGYTYIYSPIAQKVDVGLWWGEHYLNGKALKGKREKEGINRRSDVTMDFKKGWNYFFVKYGVVWAHWDFTIILPNEANLKISPIKEFDSKNFMMSAGPYDEKEDQIIKKLNLPINPDQLPQLSTGWEGQQRGDLCNNPSVSIVYSYFDKKIEHDKTQVQEIQLSDKSGNAVLYNMGKNTYGRMFVEYTAPAGTILDIAWAEDKDGDRVHLLKRYAQYMSARHIAKEGKNYFEVFKPNGHKYLHVNIKNNTGKVILHKVGSIKQNYPLEELGRFECSDRLLNNVWKLGKRTIELCADDVYTDPFRERGLYAGDLLPETTIGYVISGDTKLARKSMQQIQGLYDGVMKDYTDNVNDRHGIDVLSDFPILTLINLKWYYDVTKDLEFLKYSYPKYQRMMDSLAATQQPNGLFGEVRSFIEWSLIEKGDAQLATTQSLMSKAFKVMADISKIVGNDEKVERYMKYSESSKLAISKLMWDEDKKAYFDGFKGGKKIESYFPNSSAWPVIFDVSTDQQNKYINEFLIEELDSIGSHSRNNKITPYGSFYALGALYQLENAKTAEWFMRKYWQQMVFVDNDCVWENFGDEGGQGSKSHGWSGAPTWYLSTFTLGVKLGFPESTDLSFVTIAPQSESINWAKGVVPHPTGPVTIDWSVKGDNLFLNYKVKQSVKVVVEPKGRLAKKVLWVNGKKI